EEHTFALVSVGVDARPAGPVPVLVFDLGEELGATLGVESVDEQAAVEVVGLVLEAAGHEALAADLQRLAAHVEAARDRPQPPRPRVVEPARQREAPL